MLRLHLHLMEASACRRPETTCLSCNTALHFFEETPQATFASTFSIRGRHLPHLVISGRHISSYKIQSFPSPHLHISASPQFCCFFLTAQLWSRQKAISAISLQQRFPEHRDCCSQKKHLRYDIPPYHLCIYIYMYIYIQYIHYIIIFYLLYYIILHTTSPNIQVHVLMLCQSPPILCEYQITRIAKVQDEESTRNDKNHKRIIESYKNHVFKKT